MGDVEPELQAYIANLVSALGGEDVSSGSGVYKLGDEALGCLRDLKKWLQLYDAKLNRWDVARCISETTLVATDLVEIMSQWEIQQRSHRPNAIDERIALACLELLVPLTWPIRLDDHVTANHLRHAPHLQRAQISYKRSILTHPDHAILTAVLRIAARPMTVPAGDRSVRDDGILKLAISFFRNLLAIDSSGAGEDDVDISHVIVEYERQKVLRFLVTLGAGIGSVFDNQDTLLLECLYHMIRGIDPTRLFADESTTTSLLNKDLSDLLQAEKQLRKAVFQPSRHSRFGTLISMGSKSDGDRLSVSGQRAITSVDDTLEYIDDKKRWHKPVRRTVDDRAHWNIMVTLDDDGRSALQKFVGRFLDASFNPTFIKLRRMIERDSDRIADKHLTQYLYVTSWLLQAELDRSQFLKRPLDFKLVGGCLNRQMFSVVMALLRKGFEPGELQCLDLVMAGMRSLRVLLVFVQLMSQSSDPATKDVSESMKARLFYEEEWLMLLSHLPRFNSKQPLAYSCEAVELSHVLLRMLDEYSKQHTYIFVKSQRKARKAKGSAAEDESNEGEAAVQEAARVTRERKFVFSRFLDLYARETVVDTYERLLSQFREVRDEHLKHCFVFFHRLFVRAEHRALFFRLTFMRQLVRLTSVREGLPADSSVRGVAEQFLAHYTNKLTKGLERTPSLFVELLFNKYPSDIYYFDTGQDKNAARSKPKFEYEFVREKDLTPELKVGIVVAALIDNDATEHVRSVENALMQVATDRTIAQITRPLTQDKQVVKMWLQNACVRLLLRLAGMRVSTHEVFIPSGIDTLQVLDVTQWISKYLSQTLVLDAGKEAMDFLRRTDSLDGNEPLDTSDGALALGDGRDNNNEDDEFEAENDAHHFADPRLQPLSADEREARKIKSRRQPARHRRGKDKSKDDAYLDNGGDDSDMNEESVNGSFETMRRQTAKGGDEHTYHKSPESTGVSANENYIHSPQILQQKVAKASAGSPSMDHHHLEIPSSNPKRRRTVVDDDSD